MRATIWRQPADLRALLGDLGPVEEQAGRLEGRRIIAVGTGTSWHAANHAVWLFREAGVDCRALQAMDAAQYGIPVQEGDAIIVFSHRNTKRFSSEVLEQSRELQEIPVVVIGGVGSPGVDLETVEPERSAAFTASHLGALLRCAQLANALGASLPLEAVPGGGRGCARSRPRHRPTRASARVHRGGAEPMDGRGRSAESARDGARRNRRALGRAVLPRPIGGGRRTGHTRRARRWWARGHAVTRGRRRRGGLWHPRPSFSEPELGEALSVFPLTVIVQRIALELAEQLGTDPDAFGYDVPGRKEAWTTLTL